MNVLRTVRGDIDPSEMGPTDSHEHLFFVSPLQPGDDMADLGRSTEEARTPRRSWCQDPRGLDTARAGPLAGVRPSSINASLKAASLWPKATALSYHRLASIGRRLR